MLRKLWNSKLFKVGSLLFIGLIAVSAALRPETVAPEQEDFEITDNTTLWKVMVRLGKIKAHAPKNPDDKALLEQGRSLVENGYAIRKGGKSSKIAKIPCAACHTQQADYHNLRNFDPEAKLRYADTANMPFLPGSTMYGMVNRAMFFNNDLMKHYKGPKADMLPRAHYNLREAISTCNQVFAGGRKLKDWEQEAILMHLWTKELKMGELNLSEEHMKKVKYAVKNNHSNARAVNLLRLYYPEVYPAHLSGPADEIERRMVSPVVSNFYIGRILYERSCLHCHENKKYSKFKLDYKQKTFKKLRKNFEGNPNCSIYEAHRVGPGQKWKGDPFYTEEHLTNAQLKDLRYFIQTMARMGEKALDYYGDNH